MRVNNVRAREANAALQAFRLESGDLADEPDGGDEKAAVYMLAAFHHLCDAQGWNVGEMLREARGVYVEDLNENNGESATPDFAEG